MDGKTMIRMHFSSVAQVCSPCVQLKKKKHFPMIEILCDTVESTL